MKSLKLSDPIIVAKRIFGLILVTFGCLVMLGALAWLFAYFVGQGLSFSSLQRSFGVEIFYWMPVLIFCIPGFMMLFQGRRLMKNDPVNWIELLLLVTVTALVIFTLINFEL